jgi:transcription elongation factor GreA
MGIPVTAEGKRKMQGELDQLSARIPVIAKQIEEAREKGDLRENAEYHAAREDMSLTNARLSELKNKLANCQVVDESQIDTTRVAFGATIELQEAKARGKAKIDAEIWYLVGEGEDDPLENRILTSSPMGQALLGKRIGDTVEVKAPMGTITFKVIKISY